MIYYYCRTSGNRKKMTKAQVEQYIEMGATEDEIIVEYDSGYDEDRKKLKLMLSKLQEGDFIYCKDVSRLTRNGRDDCEKIINHVHRKGATIYFYFLDMNSKNDTNEILEKAIDETYIYNNHSKKIKKGLEKMKKRKEMKQGKRKDDDVIAKAIADYNNGRSEYQKVDICKKYNLSRPTFDKYLKIYTDQQKNEKLLQR